MASVTLKNVYKKYYNWPNPNDELVAVRDFNLDIKDHEVIVLVGPSGCGKSTTLRMIAGLENINMGELYIDGKLVNGVEPKDRGIAMVFQNYALFPHMTVFENIAFGLQPTDMSDAEIKEKVEKVARITDITHLFTRKPRELSGGQKQRVALARALVKEHKVVLLDEPLSNLDARLRTSMRTELTKLHQKFDMTFIYVTHDQSEAMTIADRLVVMKNGMIQQVGTPEEIYTHPCNLFVAGFIGTPMINFINANVNEDNGGIFINFNGIKIKLPESKYSKVREYIGKEVFVGVRPEDMYGLEASSDNFNAPHLAIIDAEVQVREFLGDSIYLYCVNGTQPFTVRVLPAFMPDFTARSGDKIKVGINREKIYLFDKDTEMAVVN
ncbi:MAG: ATP-binding cassette domain-containing protein [Oscillospiraceae bacterium]|nr:ATP-binding cassette domain-containing protein [Oscillospiraceae bacterium]